MSSHADRNLLFGVLALQMDLITRDQLVEAMNAWLIAKDRSLADLLLEKGYLDADSKQVIQQLVEKRIDKHAGNVERTLATLGSVSPQLHAEIAALGDSDVQASLAHVAAAPDAEATQAYAGRPTSDGRFSILHLHARGGLGEVFVAKDCELNRQVALKQIQGPYAHDPNSRTRFLLEAEVTGCLEHPGIVPVYGLGHYDDGCPYYAMRLIHGESLRKRIDDFHDEDKRAQRSASEQTIAFRNLLGQFVDVCQAVEYAHSRGVVHRDLKPSNVMVGKFGETLVVDWGLAKPLGQREEVRSVGDESAVVPSSGSSATEMGAAIGTPAYMSPEQAAGKLDLVGPASDVYSLGATLYHIITGRAPFEGQSHEALQKTRQAEFPRPREISAQVPAALEAICLQAMQLEPPDRYDSASELAHEIDRWLADEPVLAWREPLPVRIKRWVRHHRALVTGSAAAALVALVSLAVGLVVVTDKNRQLEQTAARAEENFHQAKAVVDEFLTEVSDSRELLRGTPGTQQLRSSLLEMARQYYEDFIRENQSSGLEEQLAAAYVRLANVHREIGQLDKATEEYQKAIEIREQLVRENPLVLKYQDGLASSYNSLANVYLNTGKQADAAQQVQKALEIREQLVRENPSVPEYQDGLASSYYSLGRVYQNSGRGDDGAHLTQKILEIREQLVREDPLLPEYQDRLADSTHNLGVVYGDAGRDGEAAQQYEKALEIREQLVRENPSVPEYKADLARHYNNLGSLYARTAKLVDALQQHKKAIEIRERLVQQEPLVPEHQHCLASSYNNLGLVYQITEKYGDAASQHKKAIEIREQLVRQFPSVPEYQADLAVSHSNLNRVYGKTGRLADAAKQHQNALEIREQLVRENPSVTEYRHVLAGSYSNLANEYHNTARYADAARQHQKAIEIREQLVADNPSAPEYQHDLAANYNNLGVLYAQTAKRADAAQQYQKAIEFGEQLVRDNPSVPEYQTNLAGSYNNLGSVYKETGKLTDAAQQYQKAIEIGEQLVRENPSVPEYQARLARSHDNLGVVYRKTGKLADAAQPHQNAIEIQEQLVQENPTVLKYQADLASSNDNLGIVFKDIGRVDEAAQQHQNAIEILGKLVQENLSVPAYQAQLASSYHGLGNLYLETGWRNPSVTAQQYQKSIEIRERLVQQDPSIPAYQNGLASSYNDLGQAYQRAGKLADAAPQHHKAIEVFEPLVRVNPSVPAYGANLAISYDSLGGVYRKTGRADDEAQQYRKAMEIRERLVQENPFVPEYQADLARSHNNLGSVYGRTGKPADAAQQHQQALEIQEQLVRDNPSVPAYQANLAMSYNNLGQLYSKIGRRADAVQQIQKALEIQAQLVQEDPSVTDYEANLALSYNNLGQLYSKIGRRADAVQQYHKAIEIHEPLVQENPSIHEYQVNLALSYTNLSSVYEETGKLADAAQQVQKALEIREQLVRENQSSGLERELGETYFRSAFVHEKIGHLDKAAKEYQNAIEIFGKLVRQDLSVTEDQANLAGSYNNLGDLYRALGKPVDAAKQHQNAIKIQEQLLQENPSVIEYQADLSISYNNLGNRYRALGQPIDATKQYDKAIEIREQLVRENPLVTEYQANLGVSYNNLGNVHRQTGKLADAAQQYQKANEIREQLVQQNPSVPEYRTELMKSYTNLGNVYANTEKLDSAVAAYRRAAELDPDEAVVHRNLVLTLLRINQSDAAIIQCRERVRLKPDDPVARQNLHAALSGQAADLLFDLDDIPWTVLEPVALQSSKGAALTHQPDGSIFAQGQVVIGDEYTVTANTNLSEITALRLEALPDERLPRGGPGRHETGAVHLKELSIARSTPQGSVELLLAATWTTHWQYSASLPENESVEAVIDGTGAFFSSQRRTHSAVFETRQATELPASGQLRAKLEFDGPYLLGRFRLSVTRDPRVSRYGRIVKTGGWPAVGLAHSLNGNTESALDTLKTAAEEAKTGRDAFVIAMAYWQLKHKDDALRYYQQGLEWMKKNDADALLVSLAREASTSIAELAADEANQMIEDALIASAHRHQAKDGGKLAEAYLLAGNARKVIEVLDQTIAASPTSQTLMLLAMAHHQLGHEEQAQQWYQQAVARLKQHPAEDVRQPLVRQAMTEVARLTAGAAADLTDQIRNDQEKIRIIGPLAEIIVPSTSVWKWLHPVDGRSPAKDDIDFDTSFFNLDYDDSAWQTGADSPGPSGGFGYGDPVGVQFDTPPSGQRMSAYFRHAFTTDQAYDRVAIAMQRDDGVIVYLDGDEVGRSSMDDGAETYGLFASQQPAGETQLEYFALTGALEPGQHVLAISLHNIGPNSSDLRIGNIELLGVPRK